MADSPIARAGEKAQELALEVHRVTQKLPESEQAGLTGQLRSAAIAAASARVEERGESASADAMARLAAEAAGAVADVVYCLMLGRDLGYLTEADTRETTRLAAEALRRINGLRTAA